MSTSSGATLKGEKERKKFQQLDLTSFFKTNNKTESSEPHQLKNSIQRNRNGMCILGKVPAARRAPINLPSEKVEHSGNYQSVSLVPSGGTGWGSKPGESGPGTPAQNANNNLASSTTTANSTSQSQSAPAPASAIPVQPQNVSQPSVATLPTAVAKPVVGSAGGDKSWSSVMSGGDSVPNFLAHQSPQFQQEFPSLSGAAAGQGPPGKGSSDAPYGPGPSLRPQTEGSWMQGGCARTVSGGGSGGGGPPVPHPYLPQESSIGSLSTGSGRSNLGPYGVGGGLGGPPMSIQSPMPPQLKTIVPPFMLRSNGGNGAGVGGGGGFGPSGFPSSMRSPRFNQQAENSKPLGSSRPMLGDVDEVTPIIKEEDLSRMDEITNDAGWAAHDEIDFNQTLAFSDEESPTAEEEAKDRDAKKSLIAKDEQKAPSSVKDQTSPPSSGSPASSQHQQPLSLWQGRGGLAGSNDFRNQVSRIAPSSVPDSADAEEMWAMQKKRQTQEMLTAMKEKAKQRKEEVVKRSEEIRSKMENDKVKKIVKEDGESSVSAQSSTSSWEKEDKSKDVERDNFRQVTQMDPPRSSFKERESGFSKHYNPPPRFLNKSNTQGGGNSGGGGPNSFNSRQQQSISSNSVNELRSSPSSGPQLSLSSQPPSTISPSSTNHSATINGKMRDDKEEKSSSCVGGLERRDRATPEPPAYYHERDNRFNRNNARNDRNYDRKFDGLSSTDYNRSNYEHVERDRNKDVDYRNKPRDDDWESRRGNSTWDRQEDRNKREFKKPSSDHYNKNQGGYTEDSEFRERFQKSEVRDRPNRPDSRDSRTSRDSRNSRDSVGREESRSIPEAVNNDYGWGQPSDFDKDAREDKLRKKDVGKEQKRREGHVPVPIPKERMEEATKEKESWSKLQAGGGVTSGPQPPLNQVSSWNATPEDRSNKHVDLNAAQNSNAQIEDEAKEKLSTKEDSTADKKKDSQVRGAKNNKEKSVRGGRTRGPSGRQSGFQASGNSFYNRNNWGPSDKDNYRRHGPGVKNYPNAQKSGAGSDSDASIDEISASTESGKEDKKERKGQRSPRTNEKKKDKDERNARDSKKSDEKPAGSSNSSGVSSRKPLSGGFEPPVSSSSGTGGGRKEAFAPRGEPSRWGRGGFRANHYGPPGSKSPFSSQNQQDPLHKVTDDHEKKTGESLDKAEDSNKSKQNKASGAVPDVSFQEVRSKKPSKESSKDETKPRRGGPANKGPGPGPVSHSSKGVSSGVIGGNKSGSNAMGKGGNSREWPNNKPPRMVRLENERNEQAAQHHQQQQQLHHQQQQDISDMNKLNHNVPLFPINRAPPPSVNAWDKPITASLRTTPPPNSSALHAIAAMNNVSEKSSLSDHLADKVNASGAVNSSGGPVSVNSNVGDKSSSLGGKLSRDVDKGILDGATPPVQTIVFENTNFKSAPTSELMKPKYSLKGPRIEKGKLTDDLDSTSSHSLALGFKTGVELKNDDGKTQEALQMHFTKNEDNGDMKLDFCAFESDLAQFADEKPNYQTDVLEGKIALVKKVWDPDPHQQQHHIGDEGPASSSAPSFASNFADATLVDHSSSHQVDDGSAFNNADVYSPALQANAASYAAAGGNVMKQDHTNSSANMKPQPQETAVLSSGIGTPNLSSPPPPFNQAGHFNNYQTYGSLPAIPSPPAVIMPTSGQQLPNQGELYHQFVGNQMLGSQTARSGFSQFPYNMGQNNLLGQASAFNQQSIYLQHQAAPPNPQEVFTPYRIPPSAFGQSQQLSNNPSTVLLTSSSNTLMSASVKSSPQPAPLAAIGTKAPFQSTAVPSQQVAINYLYEPTPMLHQPNYSALIQQRHGGTGHPSYYAPSSGGQANMFQANSLLGNQSGLPNAAAAFNMTSFNTASATNPIVPSSTTPLGIPPTYNTSQMGFRAPAPMHYKTQHQPDASKSPSTNQEVLNSVFSSGGGQVPSPKSARAGNNGGGGKQLSQPPQQPSPTQPLPKYAAYQQQNLWGQVGQQMGYSVGGGQRSGGSAGLGSVRGGGTPGPNSSGGGSGGVLGSNGGRYPTPIQRPGPNSSSGVGVGSYQSHLFLQQQQQQQQQQQRHNRPPQTASRQQHVKNSYSFQQETSVKMEPTMDTSKTNASTPSGVDQVVEKLSDCSVVSSTIPSSNITTSASATVSAPSVASSTGNSASSQPPSVTQSTAAVKPSNDKLNEEISLNSDQ